MVMRLDQERSIFGGTISGMTGPTTQIYIRIPEAIVKTMVPVVVTMTSYQVTNVRLNVAKTFVKLFRRINDATLDALTSPS